MNSSSVKKTKGRGRGVLAMRQTQKVGGLQTQSSTLSSNGSACVNSEKKNLNDGRKNEIVQTNKSPPCHNNTKTDTVQNSGRNQCTDSRYSSPVTNTVTKIVPKVQKGGMIAKYNYKANPSQPGGFPELSLKQGESLTLIHKGHAPTNNLLWWEVRNEAGQQGFVPATYCMVIEEKVSALPWLESQRLETERAEKKRLEEAAKAASVDMERRKNIGFGMPTGYKPAIKQYVSSYGSDSQPAARNTAEANKEFYCELCDKNLNGPTPYKMHMNSKAHREEVEYQKSKLQGY